MAKQHQNPNNLAARQAAKETTGYGRWDFVKLAPMMGAISLILTIASIVLIATKGLNYSIDFRGGTELQVQFDQTVEAGAVRQALTEAGIGNSMVQSFGRAGEFLIRLEIPRAATEREVNEQIAKQVTQIRTVFQERLNLPSDGILRVDTVGPAVGSELKRDGLLASVYSFLMILIYVGLRFDFKYAPGAVLCLIHDAALTVGLFSLLGKEFSIQTMAAVLTLIGYSINDTIVTFDRIRETVGKLPDYSSKYVINKAINETMSRTILTAATTLVACVALYIFGGGVIADIAFTLIIGVIVGTYSSIYVAAPMILVMEKYQGPKTAPQPQAQTA